MHTLLASRSWLAGALLSFAACANATVNVQETHELEYFVPGAAAQPVVKLVAITVPGGDAGAFHAVWLMQGAARGALARGICLREAARRKLLPGWLDGEIARLHPHLPPSIEQVRFRMRTSIRDDKTGLIMDSRQFEAVAPVALADANGALAADSAVRNVLQEVSAFCGEAAAAR